MGICDDCKLPNVNIDYVKSGDFTTKFFILWTHILLFFCHVFFGQIFLKKLYAFNICFFFYIHNIHIKTLLKHIWGLHIDNKIYSEKERTKNIAIFPDRF